MIGKGVRGVWTRCWIKTFFIQRKSLSFSSLPYDFVSSFITSSCLAASYGEDGIYTHIYAHYTQTHTLLSIHTKHMQYRELQIKWETNCCLPYSYFGRWGEDDDSTSTHIVAFTRRIILSGLKIFSFYLFSFYFFLSLSFCFVILYYYRFNKKREEKKGNRLTFLFFKVYQIFEWSDFVR